MSTIDPAKARTQRRDATTPRFAPLALGMLFFGGFWFLFGIGIADAARYPLATLYLSPDKYPENTDPGLLWAIFVGVFAGSISAAFLNAALTRRISPGAASALETAVALAAVGIAIPIGAAASWVPPSGPGFPFAAAWDLGALLAWTSQYWVPGILLFFAVCLIVVAVRSNHKSTVRAERLQALMANGTQGQGTVTESIETGLVVENRPCIRYTVKFTDHRGIDRWVTKTDSFTLTTVPRRGDPATVWYDPNNPGDEDSILVIVDFQP